LFVNGTLPEARIRTVPLSESRTTQMHYDDRLATVLRARIGGDAAARTQFRQLVDLLGTLPSEARGPVIDEAHVRLAELVAIIPAADQAKIIAGSGLRLRSPRLLAELAHGNPRVAGEALGIAQLSESEWLDLIPALPPTVRSLVRIRRDLGERVEELLARLGISGPGLPPAGTGVQVPANDVAGTEPGQTVEGIGAIVQRIEAYRKRKAAESEQPVRPEPAIAMPVQPLGAITFTCDESGRITWTNVAGPALTGLLLAVRDETGAAHPSPALIDAFRSRQPLRGVALSIDGAPAVAGQWQVDAVPQFDKFGRFAGYHGRLRRPAKPAKAVSAESGEADRIRQLLHELRTPVNAIQGFAEVIQQQLFGPTPHEYRAHAAAIAGDAARMLAGFDDLERLAKLASGAMSLEQGLCDFSEVIRTLSAQLNAHGAARSSGFSLIGSHAVLPVSLERSEAERLVWRLLATLAAASAPGETLAIELAQAGDRLTGTFALPAALALQPDIMHAAAPSNPGPLSTGMFGTGFALRLATSEARAAGGSLERREGLLVLDLPLAASTLTTPSDLHTQNQGLAV